MTVGAINYLNAYLFSTIGGYLILMVIVPIMHRTSGTKGTKATLAGKRRPVFRWLDIWVGFTERAIATTLFIWAPAQLPVFIGGWVAAKIAAGWKSIADIDHAPASVIALVGNAISFSIAIAAGYWVHPASLLVLADPK